jgi:hypothetical protein
MDKVYKLYFSLIERRWNFNWIFEPNYLSFLKLLKLSSLKAIGKLVLPSRWKTQSISRWWVRSMRLKGLTYIVSIVWRWMFLTLRNYTALHVYSQKMNGAFVKVCEWLWEALLLNFVHFISLLMLYVPCIVWLLCRTNFTCIKCILHTLSTLQRVSAH